MVFEKTTVIGRSTEGFDEATEDALNDARERFEDVHWVEVKELGVEVASVEDHEFQAEVEVAYRP
jgi:hypothetical protein